MVGKRRSFWKNKHDGFSGKVSKILLTFFNKDIEMSSKNKLFIIIKMMLVHVHVGGSLRSTFKCTHNGFVPGIVAMPDFEEHYAEEEYGADDAN